MIEGMLRRFRGKNVGRWLPGYVRWLAARALARPRFDGPRHLLFAFCDHWEPRWGDAPPDVGAARVRAWEEGYPKLAREFTDADGHHPRHSFFFPGEQYAPETLDALGRLAAAGLGEAELHLHHDGDTSESLRRDLARYLDAFVAHGHLARGEGGRPRYAFIHGNWALANPRRDRRWCGVDDELPLLFETGCYADFTFPSTPDESQPGIVNRIYWPEGDLTRARSYERGVPARVGEVRRDRVLMIEGPLAPARRPGFFPPVRIEYGALTAVDPANPIRVRTWVDQGIHVEGRPEWVFVKVYTHGAPEQEAASLLGDGGRALHRELARYNDGARWVLHYVTAREMYNIAIAAMEGASGDPGRYRDHALPPPPAARP